MPFYDFLFDFLFIFSLLKSRKRELLTCRCWRAKRAQRQADTWRAGPSHGCDVALRPRGRAVGGPREAQEAHRAQPRGRRPRDHAGPHGRPCGAPRGRRGQ